MKSSGLRFQSRSDPVWLLAKSGDHGQCVEATVLHGMRTELAEPSSLKAYARAYNEELKQLAGDAIRNRARLEARAAETQAERDRAMRSLIKGRLSEEEAELPDLWAELDGA